MASPDHRKSLCEQVRSNLRRDYLRKRSLLRILLLLVALYLLYLFSGVHLKVTVGKRQPKPAVLHQAQQHRILQPVVEEEDRRQFLEPREPAAPPDPVIRKPDPPPRPAEPKPPVAALPERVHAYMGPRNVAPIYLDFVDRNAPWNKEEEEESKKKWKLNKYLSDRTPLNRDTEDGRHQTCRERTYQRDMPKASVVMVFYNEALSVVLRTVYTVIKESDPRLLHEILLYDDCSTLDELKAPLERHTANLPVKITVVRATDRGGLVKARLFAARAATGEVLVYLDAHCEPTPGWLEPLLEPIAKNRTTVTAPSLDDINWQSLTYSGADTIWVIGGVNWLMNMLWAPIPQREMKRRQREDPYPVTANIRTATMAGGLFAMDRLYFKELGEYDEGMGVWGGENMELSFRIWMCGGTMLFIPCSKVGHIFRPSHPYDFMGENIVSKNYVRAARVWFDDELEFFYKLRPQFRDLDAGDLSERFALRERLQCKSYAWFIQNIYPELPLERDLIGAGRFRNDANFCFDTRGGDLAGGNFLYLGDCGDMTKPNMNTNRFMMFTKDGRIMGLNYCLDSGYGEEIRFEPCHLQGGSQQFSYDVQTKTIRQNEKRCLTGNSEKGYPVLDDCREGDSTQIWNFEHLYI